MRAMTVGSNIDSWCTRCKLLLAHTVEAMVGTKVTRVHCNTCGAQHAYRPHAPGTKTTTRQRPATSATRRAAPPAANNYQALIAGRDATKARRYATSDRYRRNDVIQHPSFGLGVVVLEKEGNKVDVLFPDGSRTLMHCR